MGRRNQKCLSCVLRVRRAAGGRGWPWDVPVTGIATFKVALCPVNSRAGQVTVNHHVQNFLQ
eukprot:10906-Eustigmatos_ZCMA.PRE.1